MNPYSHPAGHVEESSTHDSSNKVDNSKLNDTITSMEYGVNAS